VFMVHVKCHFDESIQEMDRWRVLFEGGDG
jgi:hypothetical protein